LRRTLRPAHDEIMNERSTPLVSSLSDSLPNSPSTKSIETSGTLSKHEDVPLSSEEDKKLSSSLSLPASSSTNPISSPMRSSSVPISVLSASVDLSRSSSSEKHEDTDRKFILEHLSTGDELHYYQWMKELRKNGKLSDCIIAVSSYRLLMLGKSKLGKRKISKESHLYDLVEVKSQHQDSISLEFRSFTLELRSNGIVDTLPALLYQRVRLIGGCFPETALPRIRIEISTIEKAETSSKPNSVRKFSDFEIDYGADQGLIACYRAYCNYYRREPSDAFINFLESLISSDNHELSLNECPGIEKTLDLAPIALALRYSTLFTSLSLCDIERKEALSAFSETFASNVTLRRLIFNHLEVQPEHFQQIGEAIRGNINNSFEDLDFSYCNMRDQGAISLCKGLEVQRHPLRIINFSHCGIQSKGISALMDALHENTMIGFSLEELLLSGNVFGPNGTSSFAVWIVGMKSDSNSRKVSCLSKLCVAGCQIELHIAFHALRSAALPRLSSIDFSENRCSKQALEFLVEYLQEAVSLGSLRTINLSASAASVEFVSQVLIAIANGSDLHSSLQIDLSNNELGVSGAKAIANVIPRLKSFKSLILRSNGFKKEGLLLLLKALEANPSSIKGIDLSDNLKGRNPEVVKEICNVLNDQNGLENLSIAENDFGKDIIPLLKTLSTNKTLLSLDISGNAMGDSSATALAESLVHNISLTTVRWDENGLGVGGLRAFASALRARPKPLACVQTPEKDITKAIAASKDHTRTRETLYEILENISSTINGQRNTNTSNLAQRSTFAALKQVEKSKQEQSSPQLSPSSSSSSSSSPPQQQQPKTNSEVMTTIKEESTTRISKEVS